LTCVTQVDMEDCKADVVKFDEIYSRTKNVFEAMQDLEVKLRPAEFKAHHDQVMGLHRQKSLIFEKAK
jgi:hypothetical protein